MSGLKPSPSSNTLSRIDRENVCSFLLLFDNRIRLTTDVFERNGKLMRANKGYKTRESLRDQLLSGRVMATAAHCRVLLAG